MKARETVYKGITMRSRNEAGFAQWLDQWRTKWEYEPTAYAMEDGQYLPDFRLEEGVRISNLVPSISTIYVEVKPNRWADFGLLEKQAKVIGASEPEAVLVLARPQRRPLVVACNPHFEFVAQASWGLGYPVSLCFPATTDSEPWAKNYWTLT